MKLLNEFEKCYPEINKMAKELCESKIEEKPVWDTEIIIKNNCLISCEWTHLVKLFKLNHRNTDNFQHQFLFEKIEGLPKVFLKVINLKNQGMYDKESDDIVTEICGESSFQERLS